MLKVAVTGHSSGIGKELFQRFDSIGFDLTNGYSIRSPEEIASEARDCDVFINNAQDEHYQLEMFKAVERIWKSEDRKRIINISSYSVTMKKNNPYTKNKLLLEEYSRKSSCWVTNVRPSRVDTDLIRHITDPKKMDPAQVADIIEYIIRQPLHIPLIEITDF